METQKQDCVYVCFCRRLGDGVVGLNVPVGIQVQASLDISGVVGGKGGVGWQRGGRVGACEGILRK